MKISIIIPVYNIEEYLNECLDSIVCQDCTDIEIILVNDGSTDNSGKIADSYAQKYPFIQVVHQKNQGVSVARNNGLLSAKGDYIWFVDGDDWIGDSAIQKIIPLLDKNSDIIFLGSNEVYLTHSNRLNSLFQSIYIPESIENNLEYLLYGNLIKWFVWDKLIKTTILKENNILFSKSYRWGEDYLYNVMLIINSYNFSYIQDDLYYYRRMRVGSASTIENKDKLRQLMMLLQESIDIVNNSNVNETIKNILLIFSSKLWFATQPPLTILDKKERMENYRILHDIYTMYEERGLAEQIIRYNRGAKLLNILVKFINWQIGYHLYAVLINFRRSKFGIYLIDKIKG